MSAIPRGATIFTDFDGTVSRRDVAEAILQKYTGDDWWKAESAYRAGKIGSREAIIRQFGQITAPPAEILAHVGTIGLDPHFKRFSELCAARGIPLIVLSEGLDIYINHLLAREGVELPVYANHIEFEGGIKLSFPHQDPACSDCGVCKTAIMRRAKGPKVYVGDGYSDRCPAEKAADVVFAKGHLAEHCKKEGIEFIQYCDFGDIIRHLEG